MAFSACELVNVSGVLRWGWNKNAYLTNPGADGEGALTEATRTFVDGVDKSITAPFFWAWWVSIEFLAKYERSAFHWVGSCSCHWHLIAQHDADVPKAVWKQWLNCPFRNMRASDVAANELLEMLAQLKNSTAAGILIKLPNDITPAQRQKALRNFNTGSCHLMFYITAKLVHTTGEPFIIFKVSHLDDALARHALRVCLASRHLHPRMVNLRSEPLRSLALQVVDDGLLNCLASTRILFDCLDEVLQRPPKAVGHRHDIES